MKDTCCWCLRTHSHDFACPHSTRTWWQHFFITLPCQGTCLETRYYKHLYTSPIYVIRKALYQFLTPLKKKEKKKGSRLDLPTWRGGVEGLRSVDYMKIHHAAPERSNVAKSANSWTTKVSEALDLLSATTHSATQCKRWGDDASFGQCEQQNYIWTSREPLRNRGLQRMMVLNLF